MDFLINNNSENISTFTAEINLKPDLFEDLFEVIQVWEASSLEDWKNSTNPRFAPGI